MKQNIACYTTISLLFIISILNVIGKPLPDDYININVDEAWNLLSDTSNGIQIPVDVRTDSEWKSERIDTSFPEDPRHYTLSKLQTERGLQEFISMYDGSDIILYCKSGGRSSNAAYILSHSGFSGTIYSMVGGITAWKNAGYPIKTGNTKPYTPSIDGSSMVNVNVLYNFKVIAKSYSLASLNDHNAKALSSKDISTYLLENFCAINFRSVDLPDPEGPLISTISPSLTSNLIFLITSTLESGYLNLLI